jgi:hypothetical protein
MLSEKLIVRFAYGDEGTQINEVIILQLLLIIDNRSQGWLSSNSVKEIYNTFPKSNYKKVLHVNKDEYKFSIILVLFIKSPNASTQLNVTLLYSKFD